MAQVVARLRDLHSGMHAYRNSLIASLTYEANGPALPVELLLRPICEGRQVKIVAIPYRGPIGDSTVRPLESSRWTWKRIWRIRFG